jgi:hypothetical protein
VILLLALLGCPKPAIPEIVLPESAVIHTADSARTVLEAGATSPEPGPRAAALHWLLRGPIDLHDAYAPRAVFDPDAWVVRRASNALLQRNDGAGGAHLELLVARGSVDPYVRGHVAIRMPAVDVDWQSEKPRWRAAPLALAALHHGDQGAFVTIEGALAQADVAFEPDFILDVGRFGHEDLLDALQRGNDVAEDDMRPAYAAARLMLGDRSAAPVLLDALSTDEDRALEAVDYLVEVDNRLAGSIIAQARLGASRDVAQHLQLVVGARERAARGLFLKGMETGDWALRERVMMLAEPLLREELSTKLRRELEVSVALGVVDEHPAVRESAYIAALLVPTVDMQKAMAVEEFPSLRVVAAGVSLLR